MMAERLRPLAAVANFALERLPSAEDVYLFRGVARDEPEGRAAVRARRGARPDAGARRRTAGSSRCPSSSAMLRRGARGDPQLPGPAPPSRASACSGTGSLLYVWPTIELTPGGDRARWSTAHRPRDRRARASRWCSSAAGMRDAATAASASACCASSARPGAASWSRSTTRPPQPLQPLDEGARRIIAARRRGTCTRPRSSSCSPRRARTRGADQPAGDVRRARPRRRRAARARRPPARRRTRRGIVVGLIRNHTERYPEGMLRVVAARRPDARARLARRAGVPPDHRRARPRRGARRPGRVVRALGRARRSRWTAAPRTWTGSPRCCGGSSSSPRRAARSTSSSPASTSAPSRTGTPRRRC